MKIQFGVVLVSVIAMVTSIAANELDFSQFKGKAYDMVKNEFFAKGWELSPKQEGETSFSKQYPEVTCGSGSMAICSVGFYSKQHSVAFVVIESGGELIVSEEY
ncbi:TPA: hypothetical protein I7245_12250 [Vibrio vulnificus]|uniref:hypothetical protein n=1 Tax=Vibrio sp. 1180_3 TaxID=2528832 RepID=UPI001A26BC6E|nr:hypothetical protein [Vibrio sp. 1180_3]MDF9400894.1 hypothetical protein [Vibrio sp. 1180_3]HAS6334783.1 hypothetical protein [Vibrio vulnificus]HDY7583460.1 hypothetical protein [Vibrio vulnificus]